MPPRKRITRSHNAENTKASQFQLPASGVQISLPRAQTLPYDVLSEIFLTATHSTSLGSSPPGFEAFGVVFISPGPSFFEPTNLSRVCKSWREAALFTTRLWSQISIYIRGDIESSKATRAYDIHHRHVSMWLQLSRNSPLCLAIQFHKTVKLPKSILECIPRVEVLYPHDSFEEYPRRVNYIHHILDAISDKAQGLQLLEFPIFNGCPTHNLKLSNFPHLKRLGGVVMPVVEPETSHSLESLCGSWDAKGCIKLLTLLPGLKTFEAQFDSSEVRSDWLSLFTNQTFTSYVSNLKLRKHVHILLAVLGVVKFPSLKEAEIAVVVGDDEFEWMSPTAALDVRFFPQALENLFTSSSSTLTHITLDWDLFGLHTMIRTLRSAQSLTHLVLHTEGISDDGLLELELMGSRGQNACPNLVSLKIKISGYVKLCRVHTPINHQRRSIPEFSAEQLAKTLRSRVERRKEFSMHLRLIYEDFSERAIFSENLELNKFRKEGTLKLVLRDEDAWFSDSDSCS